VLCGVWATDYWHGLGTAIHGKATIVYRDYWPDEDTGTIPHLSIKVEDPTYMDLLIAANELIVKSGDNHHVFIEDFLYDETNDVWNLCTGS